jgi:hypothetical protein
MSVTTAIQRFGAIGGVVVALAATSPLSAQNPLYTNSRLRFEVRPYAGAYIPTGDQRDLLKDAVVAGVQLSWIPLRRFAFTGTFGWAPSKDKITPGDQSVDIYQYDVGGEWRPPAWYRSETWSFLPFIGAGVGGRTYDYRDINGTSTDVDGYGSLGGEFGFGIWGIRIEARDYVSQFKNVVGVDNGTKTRNDVTIAAGVSVRF